MGRLESNQTKTTRNISLCTNMKVYLYMIIHSGWSLAWIFIKGKFHILKILYHLWY